MGESPKEQAAFIRRTIAEVGWSVQIVAKGVRVEEPAFAYTTGLFKSFGHPELIVVGLSHEIMQSMLNICARRIRDGEKLPVGEPFGGVLSGYLVRLRAVEDPVSIEENLRHAIGFYGSSRFPVLQLVWPDREGFFPDQRGASIWIVKSQPLLA